ncbi:MAG: SRPBCC family protein [Pirellulales bacterium]
MWKLIKFLFVLLLGAVGTVLGLAAILPEDFRISHAVVIDAPPAAVFEQVNDLHNWEKWSPWLKMDPETGKKYEGPAAGEGAVFAWTSKKLGDGRMKIVKSRPDSLIDFDLHFLTPMDSHADVQFTFVPVDGKTQVEWAMSGKSPYTYRVMSTVMCMDRGLSQIFGQGLNDLKSTVEKKEAPAAAAAGTAAAPATEPKK